MTPVEILSLAKRRISEPFLWGKGRRTHDRPVLTCCVSEAIEECGDILSKEDAASRQKAFRALYNAAGLDWSTDKLVDWNDAPERTHEEVIKTLDLAIAIAPR